MTLVTFLVGGYKRVLRFLGFQSHEAGTNRSAKRKNARPKIKISLIARMLGSSISQM